MNQTFDQNKTKELLDQYYLEYNTTHFIENDPISIPHKFSQKEDIEISAFFSALIAWGNRSSIVKSGNRLIQLMDNAPADFIRNHSSKDLKRFEPFCHRTLNGSDVQFLISALQRIYVDHEGLETIFTTKSTSETAFSAIENFRTVLLQYEHLKRVEKHISNPLKNSACKRLHMFLRWMVRKDEMGVDFGIWNILAPSQLVCPLDLHTARVSRKLGLLTRTQDDRKAAEELTRNLSYLCKEDPVKYDFALFGAGVNKIL
jgi:uncharacterized protein (TIGR02757 family)